MARTKTKTCHKAEGRASTNPSLASLSRGGGGGVIYDNDNDNYNENLFPARLKRGGGL